jgi:hypothetical protein
MLEQAEDDDVPLSQVFRLGGPLVEGAEEEHGNEVDQCVGSSQPHVERLLRVLERMIADVEATLATAMDGISSIMNSMVAIKNHLSLPREAGAKTTGEVGGMRPIHAVVAAADPSQQRVHGKMDGVAHASADMRTPCNTMKHNLPHGQVARGTPSCNLVVLQEGMSSESEGNNKVRSRASLPQDNLTKMVLTNPRIRLLPVEGRLATYRPSYSKDKVVSSSSGGPSSRTQKYKDPPGYDDAADFGKTPEIHMEVPLSKFTDNIVNASTFCICNLKN